MPVEVEPSNLTGVPTDTVYLLVIRATGSSVYGVDALLAVEPMPPRVFLSLLSIDGNRIVFLLC